MVIVSNSNIKKVEKQKGLKEELVKVWSVKGSVVPVGALGAEWMASASEISVQKNSIQLRSCAEPP